MPDYTVKADVDTMLRANDKAGIRSAIGVGTTDAPTFLAQTLTGQSLTGTQATSLVDLSATWNTTGNPSLIYGRVTNTNSGASANLIDLGTFAGGSLFKVNKAGGITIGSSGGPFTISANGNLASFSGNHDVALPGLVAGRLTTSGVTIGFGANIASLYGDAAGILAQRNGTSAQAFRVYNTFPGTTANEWFEIDWKTTANTVRLFTNHAGTGGARSMDISAGATLFLGAGSSSPIRMYSGGVERWNISAAGHLLSAGATDNAYDIGASGANRPRNVYVANAIIAGSIGGASGADLIFNGASVGAAWKLTPAGNLVAYGDNTYDIGSPTNRPRNVNAASNFILGDTGLFKFLTRSGIAAPSDGVIRLTNNAGTSYTRLELGEANMGISRGTGSPEGVVTALVGSLYLRTDGGASTTLYVKESGTGNTGWVGK